MKDFVIRYWLEVLFGAALAGLTAAYKHSSKKLKCKFAEQDAIRLGVQALLRDRIIQSYNYYIEKGYIPIYSRQNLDELYSQYKNLGGNGTILVLMNKLASLPTPNEIHEEITLKKEV
jgi:hypothetical protein